MTAYTVVLRLLEAGQNDELTLTVEVGAAHRDHEEQEAIEGAYEAVREGRTRWGAHRADEAVTWNVERNG